MENLNQALAELIAGWLDSDFVKIELAFINLEDPVQREKSELHIRMAQAAIEEMEKTLKPSFNFFSALEGD